MTPTTKNGLTFLPNADGSFSCLELANLPQTFAEKFSPEEIETARNEVLTALRNGHQARYETKELFEAVAPQERRRIGGEILDAAVKTIDVSELTSFQQFLFWMGDWWYYNTTIRTGCCRTEDFEKFFTLGRELISKFILPILPEQVRAAVQEMEAINSAIGFGHFAILFSDKNGKRRIITDTKLIELHDVGGYNYLNIDQHGNPIVRCCTSQGGGRAFFDGSRLMAHPSFQTCAPKTVLFDAGYAVNSTGVTIINGTLYPLIDADDAVSLSTGAFFGMCSFSNKQHLESYAKAEATAARLKVADGVVSLEDKPIKPLGVFQPSSIRLLDNGFSLYGWSEFHETLTVIYDSVMIVDDKAEWLDLVKEEFGKEVARLDILQTESGDAAVSAILEKQPQAVVLDMHLTPMERFEGLFIANQLLANGFDGAILIASGYPDEQLQAMAKLVKGKVLTPGKNLVRLRKCLSRRAA